MLADYENNKIILRPSENNHVKVVGKSGSGKTYWSCRHIEVLSKTIPVLIVDYSGSYTKDELKRNDLCENILVSHKNPKKEQVVISAGKIETVDHVTDALIATFAIESMMQRKILREACEKVMNLYNNISFQRLFEILDELEKKEEDSEYKKNVNFLMNRLYHLKTVASPQVVTGENDYNPGIYIL